MNTIYYLDDEIFLCELVKECLNSEQLKVTTFTDASEAVAACHRAPPDIILIDYRLTDTTGQQIADTLAPT